MRTHGEKPSFLALQEGQRSNRMWSSLRAEYQATLKWRSRQFFHCEVPADTLFVERECHSPNLVRLSLAPRFYRVNRLLTFRLILQPISAEASRFKPSALLYHVLDCSQIFYTCYIPVHFSKTL